MSNVSHTRALPRFQRHMFMNTSLLLCAGTPSAPQGPVRVSSVTSDSCQVRWQPPEDDGGTPISSYVIEIRETTRSVWRRVGIVNATTTSYKV